jgi:hypothetical protein
MVDSDLAKQFGAKLLNIYTYDRYSCQR